MSRGGLIARIRSLWRAVWGRDEVEAEMLEEFAHHLELRTAALVAEGIAPAEAARRARLEFGHIESHRERARAARGLRLFDELRFSWLDVKLGVRMLRKYPALSLVSAVGLSVAIAIAAGFAGVLQSFLDPTLPFAEGERLVSVQNVDARDGQPNRQSLHDFLVWRAELGSVRELSAFTRDFRNLGVSEAGSVAVPVAQITPSAFRAVRVVPMMGRALLEEDAVAGAAEVAVIAYDEWRRRFGGDAGILGRRIRLGGVSYTVVGVMPEGFGFPVNERYWVPLRLDPNAYAVGEGPSLRIFGRLAEGATLESAQAELDAVGARMAAGYPQTHGPLRPRVHPYAHPFVGADDPALADALRGMRVAVTLLLVLVAANVAALIYARTASRMGEITVRSALGASRRRVVAQLFAEALVLALVSAAAGLTIAMVALDAIDAFQRGTMDWHVPFWLDLRLSPAVVAYVAGLAVLAAAIVGVLPALKVTGRRLGAALRQSAAGGSRLQLGRLWTAMIVAQVAIAVAVLPFAMRVSGDALRHAMIMPGYAADEVLHAALSLQPDAVSPSPQSEGHDAAARDRFHAATAELLRRVEADAAVAGATLGRGEEGALLEVETGGTMIPGNLHPVGPDHFDVLGVPLLAGRAFTAADTTRAADAAIVDRVFAERMLGGRAVLGRRVRRLTVRQGSPAGEIEAGPWLEIVGVVPDFTPPSGFGPPTPTIYVAAPRVPDGPSSRLLVRVRGAAAAAYAGRLREIAADVDPALLLDPVRTAEQEDAERRQALVFVAGGIAGATGSVLLLSAAGIYAMLSYTVARRRREIGIRAALGAGPRRLLGAVFRRAGAQLGAGALAGLGLAAAASGAVGSAGGLGVGFLEAGPLSGRGWLLVPAVATLMLGIGMLAALAPARRGLAIQPTEALRED